MINIANTWKRLAKKFDFMYWVKSHVKTKLKDSLGKKRKDEKWKKNQAWTLIMKKVQTKRKIFPADESKNVEDTETESKATILLMIFW